MALATEMRKSKSINDYPEHLNPFRDEDNHRGIRFWTLSRKPGRNNSFSLNNIKDLRNTWSLKSFMRKKKKGQEINEDSSAKTPVNEEPSPVVFRRAMQYGSSRVKSGERYEYGGSVTPLPRSRFQERMRTTSPPAPTNASPNHFTHMMPGRSSFSHRSGEAYPLPGLARSEAGNSRVSVATVGSSNPFEEDGPSPQAPARRRKKRAPLPPSANTSVATVNTSAASEMEKENNNDDTIIDDPSINIELKIVEEADEKPKSPLNKEERPETESIVVTDNNIIEQSVQIPTTPTKKGEIENTISITNDTSNIIAQNSEGNLKTPEIKEHEKMQETGIPDSKLKEFATETKSPQKAKGILSRVNCGEVDAKNNNIKKYSSPNSPTELRSNENDSTNSEKKEVVFEKVNIRLYRRNSSLSSDIDKQNGNIELSPNNKRCKSLSNNVNVTFTSYDIPLHIDEDNNEVKQLDDKQQAPQKVVCKLLNAEKPRKDSADNSISSTEREFIEIDKATRELEQEINKLNSFRYMDDLQNFRKSNGNSVSEMRSRFENSARYSPNPIPKPRRSPRAGSISPISQLSD